MNPTFFWYRALESELGIIINTDNIELAKQRLYQARALEGNPALNVLSLLDVDGQLWIINVEKANEAQRGSAPQEDYDLPI